MRIKQISVHGLFGIFDHVIPLNMDERITIIHSPNGFGKTAILKILNHLFNSRYSEFRTIPFTEFSVIFDDGSIVEIFKKIKDSKETEKIDLRINFHNSQSELVSFFPKQSEISDDERGLPLNILGELVPELEKIGAKEWIYLPTQEILSPESIVERFGDLLPPRVRRYYLKQDPDWLQNLKDSIPIHFIQSQRLLNVRFPNFSSKSAWIPTVSAYSDELAKLMQKKFAEYGTISQSLDRTFPVRVMKQKQSPEETNAQLRQKLEELEDTRTGLITVGLLDRDESSESKIEPQDIDESTKNALSVYVEDTEKKLSVFDETAKKIDLFKRIINQKFSYSYKEINFSKEKGFIFTTNKSTSSDLKPLDPTYLSSGERHEILLLYELLFKVKPKSLVLIDEPELSLHVGWQVQFLEDLQDIAQLGDFDILMATHSPGIIQDRWDLTVELKRPEQ